MTSIQTASQGRVLNALTLPIVLSGLIGEVLFETYAWLVSPSLFGFALQPSNLVIALVAKLFGLQLDHTSAFVVHFLVGSLGFGLFVYLVRVGLKLRVWMTGAVAGIVLWFVAQGILAPFIGRSFMMDFGLYTQSSFVGHLGMTLVMAYLLEWFLRRFQSETA